MITEQVRSVVLILVLVDRLPPVEEGLCSVDMEDDLGFMLLLRKETQLCGHVSNGRGITRTRLRRRRQTCKD